MTVNKKIKEIVAELGVKGSYIERRLKRPKNWFSKVTTGRQSVTVKDFSELSILLSISVADFFTPLKFTNSEKNRAESMKNGMA